MPRNSRGATAPVISPAVWVPDAATEALRDLVRAREGAKQDQLRARHRVSKFLLRHARNRPDGMRAWGVTHARWLAQQPFELPTLQVVYDEYRATLGVLADRVGRLDRAIDVALSTLAPKQQALVGALSALRGIQQVTAATLVSELGTLRRFASARQLMGYAGLVPASIRAGPLCAAAPSRKRATASATRPGRGRVGLPAPREHGQSNDPRTTNTDNRLP